jgi:hypothetical protein
MAALEIKTDILAPKHAKILKFSGYNPKRFMKIAPNLLKDVLRLSSSNFFEDKIKWDKSTENREFYGEWRGKDGKDNRTDVWVKIKVQGSQNEKEKNGRVEIEIKGEMKTEFDYSNALDKGLYLAYSRLFYSEQRRKYVLEAKRQIETIENELKKELETMAR